MLAKLPFLKKVVPPPEDLAATDDEGAPEEESRAAAVPLSLRLKAWWEGYDANAYVARASAGSGSDPAARDSAAAPPVEKGPKKKAELQTSPWEHAWPENRIRAAERVWGPGFISPGGAEYILELTTPLALMPEHSILDLHAGLGGPARTLVEAFGAWVTGKEMTPDLATRGNAESRDLGMFKRAPISSFDAEAPLLKKKGFDRAFSKELLFQVRKKEDLMKAVAQALKPDGQIVMTDYVKGDGANEDELAAWEKGEPIPPHLSTAGELEKLATAAGLNCRTVEDVTGPHLEQITSAWKNAIAGLKPREMDPELTLAVLTEAELWARRADVLASGSLRLFRIFAIRT
ncbi:MAG: methyltransferase domain-containing protein [Alphaproteobacteria bacterium]